MRRIGQESSRITIALFGRHCRFTSHVLSALINAGLHVELAVLPRRNTAGVQVMLPPAKTPRLALSNAEQGPAVLPNVAALAWSAGAALIECSNDQLATLPNRYTALRSSLIVSACFPWRLPAALLQASEVGAVNVHPSLLPRHRGPDPIFWSFHAGEEETGVTIHRMTTTLDSGPILAQHEIPIPLESRYRDIEQETIALGAELLLDVIAELSTGGLHDPPHPEVVGWYEGFPTGNDLIVPVDWSAERAFRFVHGTAPSYGPLTIELADGTRLSVTDAVSLHPDRRLANPLVHHGSLIAVQFDDGALMLVPAP